ncbi:cellulose binding domain-containing protein, partial [Micromonospora zhanjiangensis]
IDSQWGAGATGGQIVTITVANTSTASATRWNVTWPLGDGQQVVSAWNATVSATGPTATATNAAHNGALAPGAATSFGVQLSGTAPVPAPTCVSDATAPTGSGSPATTPPGGADVTVTRADNQRTVTLLVGQRLGVALGADFVPPAVSGPALVNVATSGGYPTGQPLAATYRAVTTGTVDLTSHTDYACRHTVPPCALPTLLWTVHVRVVDVSPTGTGRTVTVTRADNQRDVALRVGDTLVVSLPRDYQPPKVAPDGVLVQRDVTGGYPTDQPLVARYQAAALGRADVTTKTDGACLHQPTPCPSPQVPWLVHLTVTT